MIGDRIKELRKALHLSQTKFAERIGSVQNTITGYETGRREPSNQVIALICKEFRVNEEWLRNGTKPMLIKTDENEIEQLCERYGLNRAARVLIEKFVTLPDADRKVILDFVYSGSSEIGAEAVKVDPHAEVDRQLAKEKGDAEKCGV